MPITGEPGRGCRLNGALSLTAQCSLGAARLLGECPCTQSFLKHVPMHIHTWKQDPKCGVGVREQGRARGRAREG